MSPNSPKKRDNLSAADRAELQAQAEWLGPIVEVEPESRHTADQSPLVGKAQVYVTRTGKAYHPTGAASWLRSGTTTPAAYW